MICSKVHSLGVMINDSLLLQVFVFSSMHTSGQRLDQYTGIAAILRFPVIYEEPEAVTEVHHKSDIVEHDELSVVSREIENLDISDMMPKDKYCCYLSDEETEFERLCIDGLADMNMFNTR
jgi:hypothetical protein